LVSVVEPSVAVISPRATVPAFVTVIEPDERVPVPNLVETALTVEEPTVVVPKPSTVLTLTTLEPEVATARPEATTTTSLGLLADTSH
jgi:hypothetical protein